MSQQKGPFLVSRRVHCVSEILVLKHALTLHPSLCSTPTVRRASSGLRLSASVIPTASCSPRAHCSRSGQRLFAPGPKLSMRRCWIGSCRPIMSILRSDTLSRSSGARSSRESFERTASLCELSDPWVQMKDRLPRIGGRYEQRQHRTYQCRRHGLTTRLSCHTGQKELAF